MAQVPSADAKLTGGAVAPYASGTVPPVELTSSGGYARAALGTNAAELQAAFPVPVVSGAGMRSSVAAPGISFPVSTGAYSGTVYGFFIANAAASSGQNTGKALYYANFADASSIVVNAAGYTIQVAPFYHLDG